VSWSQEELVAAAYAVVFVFVLVYVAIIASKLVRLQRETAELVELARTRRGSDRTADYAAPVSVVREEEVGA
jgi:CcmD family protein